MTYEAAILAALVAFVAGFGLAMLLRREPEAKAPPEVAHEPPERQGLGVVRASLLEQATSIAAVLIERPDGPAEPERVNALAAELAAFGAEQWSRGLSDVRDALVAHSGLDRDLAETIAHQAIRGIEAERGLDGG